MLTITWALSESNSFCWWRVCLDVDENTISSKRNKTRSACSSLCSQCLIVSFLMFASLIALKWHLSGDLSCISVIPGEVERLLLCLWIIQAASPMNWLFISFAHFSTGLPLFSCWSAVVFCVLQTGILSKNLFWICSSSVAYILVSFVE